MNIFGVKSIDFCEDYNGGLHYLLSNMNIEEDQDLFEIISKNFIEAVPVIEYLYNQNEKGYLTGIETDGIVIDNNLSGFKEAKKALLQGGFIKFLILNKLISSRIRTKSESRGVPEQVASDIHLQILTHINTGLKECIKIYVENIRALCPGLMEDVGAETSTLKQFEDSFSSCKEIYNDKDSFEMIFLNFYLQNNKAVDKLIKNNIIKSDIVSVFKRL